MSELLDLAVGDIDIVAVPHLDEVAALFGKFEDDPRDIWLINIDTCGAVHGGDGGFDV